MSESMSAETFDPIVRATRDVRASANLMSRAQARYLVDLYYQVQEYRKRAANQERATDEADEPCALVAWTFDAFRTVERNIKSALGVYAQAQRAGEWAMSIHGIGPVLAAGLLAHIDIERAPTAGHIWRFAGLDPSVRWEKGQKRPWNAQLKTLCWKISDSFVKVHNSEKDYYGKVYAWKKALEVQRNDGGTLADQAAQQLASKKIRDKGLREKLESGKLSDGHIDNRARRYAVKLFLSHYHHVAYECHYESPPPHPYVLAHMGHVDYVPPPGWPR